jgi:HEAT repeat protein
MEKLVEREHAPRNPLIAAPALAVQFFLIPLGVVGITVLIYVGFRSLITEQRTAQDYLSEVRSGGTERRWPAAYELSRLMADPKVRADRSLAGALVQAYEEEVKVHEAAVKANDAARDDDPRVRRYLALAIGQMDPPLPEQAVADLTQALDDPDSEARISAIWALGSSGDASVVPRVQALYDSSDAGIRKMVVYALGALPGDAQLVTLRAGLGDAAPDVRWNAAVALARHGSREGVPVLKQMMDRSYVEQAVKREVRADADEDPIADVMITGIRAAAALKDESLRASVAGLSTSDTSMKVRQAALEALKAIG